MRIKSPSGPVLRTDKAEAGLQDILRRLMQQKQVRHAILAVESGDSAFRWVGAAGEANPDGTQMRGETPFFTASVTKLHIAVVILKLYERSLIGLDEPVSTYLPHALIDGLHRLGGMDRTGGITIRHLLSHTSGLADWLEDRPKGGQSLAERLFYEGDMEISIEEITRTVRDQLAPHFPPQPVEAGRQKARYSDTNFQLLIAIIESVAGKPLHRVFEEELYKPLNLRHTFHPGRNPLEATAKPATLWIDDQPLERPQALGSLGDLYSTAGDVLAFLRALIQDEVFDDPATFSLMQRRWNRFGFPLDPAALRAPGWPVEYGLGIMRFCLPRLFTLPFTMPAVIGHTGSTGSWLFHCPELDLLLCGTVDQASAGAVPYRFVPQLLRVLASSTR